MFTCLAMDKLPIIFPNIFNILEKLFKIIMEQKEREHQYNFSHCISTSGINPKIKNGAQFLNFGYLSLSRSTINFQRYHLEFL